MEVSGHLHASGGLPRRTSAPLAHRIWYRVVQEKRLSSLKKIGTIPKCSSL